MWEGVREGTYPFTINGVKGDKILKFYMRTLVRREWQHSGFTSIYIPSGHVGDSSVTLLLVNSGFGYRSLRSWGKKIVDSTPLRKRPWLGRRGTGVTMLVMI